MMTAMQSCFHRIDVHMLNQVPCKRLGPLLQESHDNSIPVSMAYNHAWLSIAAYLPAPAWLLAAA